MFEKSREFVERNADLILISLISSIVVAMMCLCTGCKVINKSLNKTNKVDSHQEELVDKSETTTIEKHQIDSILPADTAIGISTLIDLEKRPLIIDSETINTIVSYDPQTKKLTAKTIKKAQKVNVNYSKVTTVKNDIQKDTYDYKKEKETVKTKESKPTKTAQVAGFIGHFWWLFIIAIVLLAIKYRKWFL